MSIRNKQRTLSILNYLCPLLYLIKLHVIQKKFPVTEKKELRNAHYVLSDNYYHFWFRYVYPNKSIIENQEDKEIDILALNEQTKEILFCECKWQERVNARQILKELKEKTSSVSWNNVRKEFYCIFAKSFKEKFKEKNVLLFDFKDMEKVFA